MNQKNIFEVTVRFLGEEPAHMKAQFVAFLEEREAWFADACIDTEVGQAEDLFDDNQDDAPLALYEFDAKKLSILVDELAQLFPHTVMSQMKEIDREIWQDAWSNDDAQVFTTDRFIISSAITPIQPQDDDRIMIHVPSAQAFGDGRHATTLALLRAIEHADEIQGARVLDIGTGTGVLAIAIAKLGAEKVVATDLDEEIISEAQRHFELNKVDVGALVTDRIPSGSWDVIVSNILPPVLVQLMPYFKMALNPTGLLILSGFNEATQDELLNAARAQGFSIRSRVSERGWLSLTFKGTV